MKINEMLPGKIYYLKYGGTEIIGRYINSDVCNLYWNAYLHYWSGYESFQMASYSVKSGIDEIRPATQAEKHSLLRREIEFETI